MTQSSSRGLPSLAYLLPWLHNVGDRQKDAGWCTVARTLVRGKDDFRAPHELSRLTKYNVTIILLCNCSLAFLHDDAVHALLEGLASLSSTSFDWRACVEELGPDPDKLKEYFGARYSANNITENILLGRALSPILLTAIRIQL
jgi:hypothetical protein